MWTHFWDMHSGGGSKEPQGHIYIEAPEAQAKIIFYNRFGHNPDRISCTCCGPDYSISENESLADLTGFHRGCRSVSLPRDPETGHYRPSERNYIEHGEAVPEGYVLSEWSNLLHETYQTLDEFVTNDDVLIIRASDIKDGEAIGELPRQGYVWID